MVARRHCDVKAAVALSVDSHQLWHPSSGVEIKFEYVSGHLPANFSTEEIEIKDRVALMLLKSVLYPPDATAINQRRYKITRFFLAVAYKHCITMKHFRFGDKIEIFPSV